MMLVYSKLHKSNPGLLCHMADEILFYTALKEGLYLSMEKLSQELVLSITFNKSIEREELLIKKYEAYEEGLKDKELKAILNEFRKDAQEHLKMMKDKMIKLNIQG
ncbi:MAG: hypothetical protein N2645_22410 [Clostridia bacterium]|nr:hypothetical protein [Clostridia bacterium]